MINYSKIIVKLRSPSEWMRTSRWLNCIALSRIRVNSAGQFLCCGVHGGPGFLSGRNNLFGRHQESVSSGVAQLQREGVLDARFAFGPVDRASCNFLIFSEIISTFFQGVVHSQIVCVDFKSSNFLDFSEFFGFYKKKSDFLDFFRFFGIFRIFFVF